MSCRGKDGGAGEPGLPERRGAQRWGRNKPTSKDGGGQGDMELGRLPMEESTLQVTLLGSSSGEELYTLQRGATTCFKEKTPGQEPRGQAEVSN